MYSVEMLIMNVPPFDDVDAMSEWFSDCEKWAKENGNKEIETDTNTALFHITNSHYREKHRLSVLSRLKTISKENPNMDEKLKRIFIVHGHNDALRERVCHFIEKQDIKAVVLSEQPNHGQTIIEKLETESSRVAYAIILFTADDDTDKKQLKRARQNVVFEFGYFVGKLSRQKVCVIKDENAESLSDIDGVVYISSNNWEKPLLKELKEAGFSVDANKMF